VNPTGRSRATTAARVLLAAVIALQPGLLRAQALEAMPFGGVVFPTGTLAQQGRASLSHRRHVIFGGRLDGWLWRSAGIEVTVGYSPSGYHAADTLGNAIDTTGGLFAATGRFLYRFAQTGNVSWIASVGGGVVTHSGIYINNLTGRTRLTGVVGLTGRFQVSDATAVAVTAEDYVYSVKFVGIGGIAPTSRSNNDLVVSLGIVVPLGARGDEDYRVIR